MRTPSSARGRPGKASWLAVLIAAAVLLAGVLVLGIRGGDDGPGGPESARATGTDSQTGLPWMSEEQLPAEGRTTLSLIDRGGPFRYQKDGAVFGNFEGVLPKQGRGFYAEYTVPTPGEGDRGARRIVTGGGGSPVQFFYTDDHYKSFARIDR